MQLQLNNKLNSLFAQYNKRKYVSPDPLQFLYDYPNIQDREIVALIASSLAYGRVAQILKSVKIVLDKMGTAPHEFLVDSPPAKLKKTFKGFKHRFTTDEDLISMLSGIRNILKKHDSLNNCFLSGFNKDEQNIMQGLQKFVNAIGCESNYLIPSPDRGSACKRLNLFLRWMVRKDVVDPGGWQGIPKSKLIVPLDTHMANIAQKLNFTQRKTADMKMALEVTDALAVFDKKDPVKYDFALTRFGIRKELDISSLYETSSKTKRQ